MLPADNPFAQPSNLPYGLPDFTALKFEHYAPAFAAGMAQERQQIAEIVAQDQAPTVANTLAPLEQAGQILADAANAFFNQLSADATEELQDLEQELAPQLAAHHDDLYLNAGLYARLQNLAQRITAGQTPADAQDQRLLEEYLKDFRRAGISLPQDQQQELRDLNAQITTLSAQLGRLMLQGVNAYAVLFTDAAQLAGLDADALDAAAEAAKQAGHEAGYLVELESPTSQDILAHLKQREARERIMRAALSRGLEAGEHDTRDAILQLVKLRAQRAQLLGYPHHAAYIAEDGTAKTTDAVMSMLQELAPAAAANARAQAEELTTELQREHPQAQLEAWDWAYYAEQLRRERYEFDDAALRPYLELNNVLERGVFYAASKLYKISFTERTDLIGYHPQARIWEVKAEDGTGIGLFIGDFFTRPSKHGGAWMNNLVDQSELLNRRPVVVNNLNIVPPPAGKPALLTWDNVITLFHEFGHALHGLFSQVRYPSASGTEVPRDFVEFPSQVNEMWAWDPEVLENYAVHHDTAEPLPADFIERIRQARIFGEPFATTEYLAAALLDQAWHQLTPDQVPTDPAQVAQFEVQALAQAGLDLPQIPPRYRTTYFQHIFTGGYSAGYYSYIWSEVLDAASVDWFTQHGGLRPENGQRFREHVLAVGSSTDPMTAVRYFLGAEPNLGALLKRRGLEVTP